MSDKSTRKRRKVLSLTIGGKLEPSHSGTGKTIRENSDKTHTQRLDFRRSVRVERSKKERKRKEREEWG